MTANEKQTLAIVLTNSFGYPALSALPRSVFEISQRLRHDYDFVVFARGKTNREYVAQGLRVREFDRNPIAFLRGIGNLINGQGITIVHFYGSLLGANLLVSSLKSVNMSIVLSIYNTRFDFRHLAALHLTDAFKSTARIALHPSFTSKVIPRFWLRRALIDDRVLGVITPSARLKKSLVSIAGQDSKILHVPHGVDYKRFSAFNEKARASIRQTYFLSERDVVVLYAGRGGFVRGIDDLIKALARSFADLPDLYCFFLLVKSGYGSGRKVTAQIAKLAKRLLPDGRFHVFEGYVDNIEEFYFFSDIVALPYRYVGDVPEYPFVLLEAMAARSAVITTKIGAIPELITDGRNGILVKPKDIKALAAALLSLGKDRGKAEAMATEAKKSADGLDWGFLTAAVEGLYREGIEKSRVGAFFDEFSRRYDREAFDKSLGISYLNEIETAFIRECAEISPCERALCIGVGTGRDAGIFAAIGASVTGIDVSEGMMRRAREKLKGLDVEFLAGDAGESLPFQNNTFDYATCIRVAKYIPSWKHTIAEAARVIKPGGFLILEMANKASLASFGLRGANYRLFRRGDVVRTLTENGFSVTRQSHGSRLPFPLLGIVNNRPALALLIGVEQTLNRLLPNGLFSRSIIFLAVNDKHAPV